MTRHLRDQQVQLLFPLKSQSSRIYLSQLLPATEQGSRAPKSLSFGPIVDTEEPLPLLSSQPGCSLCSVFLFKGTGLGPGTLILALCPGCACSSCRIGWS